MGRLHGWFRGLRRPLPPLYRSTPILLLLAVSACGRAQRDARPPTARTNDNRQPAGTLKNGILTLALEADTARWFPEADSGPHLVVAAFAERGKPPSVPAPLVRVPLGTRIEVTLHNSLADTLVVTGFSEPGRAVPDTLRLAPGASSGAVFRARVAGTYAYHGAAVRNDSLVPPNRRDQLAGALVVDSAGAPADRVFVIGSWNGQATGNTEEPFLMAINGHTWPYTERLKYAVGDTVHWRVINTAGSEHPMHLHGSYFRVDARGSWRADSVLPPDQRRMVVTELMPLEGTLSTTWAPPRAGAWLFHCHVAAHMSGVQHDDLAGRPRRTGAETDSRDHLEHGMAGLVLGIEVSGPPSPPEPPPARRLRLLIQERAGLYHGEPGFGFVLQQGGTEPAADSVQIPGPSLVLVRGEPVELVVVNRARNASSVHWHGIELESYYDGVAGWSGAGNRRAPLIAPGDSFAARFTPPRAGTFIYHAHADEQRQLSSGLYGALLVLEPGVRWNPARDHVLLLSVAGPGDSDLVMLNGGTDTPLTAGVSNQLRLINITANDEADFALLAGGTVARWRPVAKDGADLPPAQATDRPAKARLGPGETLDVEFTPRGRVVRLHVESFNNLDHALPVREVRP